MREDEVDRTVTARLLEGVHGLLAARAEVQQLLYLRVIGPADRNHGRRRRLRSGVRLRPLLFLLLL